MNSEDVKKCTKSISILYVDNQEEQENEIVELLNEFFDKVSIFSDSKIALETYALSKSDIVFVGLDITTINALDFIKQIRAMHSYQHIVVASDSADVNTVLSLVNIGIDKFIPKPFSKKRVLSVLYGVSSQILASNEKYDLAKENQHKAKEYKKIIDVVSNGIIVIENGNIIETNSFVLKMLNMETIFGLENMLFNLKDVLIKADGYLYPLNLAELINLTKDSGHFHRILIKGGLDNKVIMFSTHTIDINAYVISCSDVTALDNIDRYNQLTKLPNQTDFIDKIGKFRDGSYELIITTLVNYTSIVKWHGKTSGFEAEKKVAEFLVHMLQDMKIVDKTYVANIEKNQYAVIIKKEDTKAFIKGLSKLSEEASLRVDSNSEKKEIKFGIWHKVLDFKDIDINELLVKISDEFELLH